MRTKIKTGTREAGEQEQTHDGRTYMSRALNIEARVARLTLSRRFGSRWEAGQAGNSNNPEEIGQQGKLWASRLTRDPQPVRPEE